MVDAPASKIRNCLVAHQLGDQSAGCPSPAFCWAGCSCSCWQRFPGAIPSATSCSIVAGAGAVAICGALLVVLTYMVQRPMVELQEKIAQLGGGDLNVSVSFAQRNDEIGDLGRNFNRMVEQLRESRDEIERLHRTQMSRAEHLATLGELATGLAHEIRNPLAGIAGVIEIIGRDLPATSPARAVVKDVRQEIARSTTLSPTCCRPRGRIRPKSAKAI